MKIKADESGRLKEEKEMRNNVEKKRKSVQEQLDRINQMPAAKGWDEAGIRTHNALACERILEVLEVADKMTNEEWNRLSEVPVYKLDDIRNLKDIKDKYDISWNELKSLIQLTWGE